MDRLGVYCRVSSEGQTEGTSLTTQEELGLKKGQELGLETVIFNEGAKVLILKISLKDQFWSLF